MKYDPTIKDLKKIKYSAEWDRILRFIKHRDEFKFTVGDILIKNITTGYGDNITWIHEKVSYTSDAPKKYIYFYENELGIGYIKPILTSGEVGTEVFPVTEFDPTQCKFQLDPEYAEHIILGDEGEVFNAAAAHQRKKKFREKAYKANKKLLTQTRTYEDILTFMHSLKIGNQFWMGYCMDNMVENKWEVTSIDSQLPTDRYEKDRWTNWLNNYPDMKKFAYIKIHLKLIHATKIEVSEITHLDNHMFITFKSPYPLSEDK